MNKEGIEYIHTFILENDFPDRIYKFTYYKKSYLKYFYRISFTVLLYSKTKTSVFMRINF